MKKWLSLFLLFALAGCASNRFVTSLSDEAPSPWTHLNANDAPGRFQFAIVSDRTGAHRPGVFEKAIEQVHLLQPEFVISIGDQIEGYTKDEAELNAQWDEFDGFLNQLDMPYFHSVGNHDISNDKMEELYRTRYGETYYHFTYKNCLFLVICTEDPPKSNISDEQIAYMKQALAENSDVRWTFVFMHKPLFVPEKDEKGAPALHAGWAQIENVLKDRPHTVFAGHRHQYCRYEKHGQSYIVLGTTGGVSPLHGASLGLFDHFTWVSMKDDGPLIANIALDGVFNESIATEKSLEFYAAVRNGKAVSCLPIFAEDPLFTRGVARLRLKNKLGAPMHIDATLTPGDLLHATETRIVEELAAGQEKTIDLSITAESPVDLKNLNPMKLQYTIQQIRNATTYEITEESFVGIVQKFDCSRAEQITVDGSLDDWPALPFDVRKPATVRNATDTYTVPEDCRFRFGTRHDDEFLYVAVDVVDDQLVRLEDASVWHQDGVEIRLLALPDPARSLFRGSGEWREALPIVLTPPDEAGEVTIWKEHKLPAGTQVESKVTETGYTVEVAVPSSYLTERQGAPWKEFRLSVAVDDSDEPGTAAQITWRPDFRDETTYTGSGTFQKTE